MPIKPFRVFLAASAALLSPAIAQADDIAIHAGRLIDGVARAPRSNVTVLIHDDRIVSVTPGFTQPAGARLIDLSHKTLLPGLIDGHVHMLVNLERHPGQLAKVTRSSYDDLMSGVGYARTTLLAGFTSARDLGGPTSAIVALKRAINSGEIDGPRLWVAGMMLGPTGGHSDLHTGFATEVTNKEWQDGIIDGPAEAVRKVRALHQAGADVIKIMPSGGVSSVGDDPQAQLMTDEEIKAVVDTAHTLHMRVAAHAHGDKAIAHAAALGVDSIEHGTFASAETYKIMKAHGTYMEPTVIAGAMIADYVRAHPGAMEKSIEAKSLAIGPIMSRNAVEAYRAGVKVSFGTDAGVFEHGRNAIEFQLMAKAGIPVIDTILAATSVAASLLDASADIGSVQPGRYADIIATDGNPLDDVTELQRVRFVMKGGKVYKGG